MKSQKTELILLMLVCWVNCVNIAKQDVVAELKVSKQVGGRLHGIQVNQHFQEIKHLRSQQIDNVSELKHDHEFASDKATNVFDSTKEKLEQEIDETVTFVARNTDYLDNTMHDYILNLNKRLENLDKNVNENRKQLEYLTFTRQQQNDKFLDQCNHKNILVSLYEHMIAQVDMCIALLQGIFANEEFIQVDRVKMITRKIFAASMLLSNIEMQELLETTETANYTDLRVQKYIIEAFNNLRNQFVNHKNSDVAYDAEQQKVFEEAKHQLDGELLIFKKDIAEQIYNLSVAEEKIHQIKDDIESNKKDEDFFSKELNFINNGNQIEQKWKSKLTQEYSNQLMSCEKAASLISQPEFWARMDQINI